MFKTHYFISYPSEYLWGSNNDRFGFTEYRYFTEDDSYVLKKEIVKKREKHDETVK